MKKLDKRCSKSSCCKGTGLYGSKPPKEAMWYTSEFGTDINSLLHSERKSQYLMPISELICYEPLPKCCEKVTELTLLLANAFLTGNKPSAYEEYKAITARSNEGWPNVGQLNFYSGMEAIENYIESLNYDFSLKFCVNFLMQKVDKISSALLYEVKWSTPTKEEPIQLATASMYFCLKMYYAMDNAAPIEVSYVYEYSHIILHPGEVKFKDMWLLDVIDHKVEFCQDNNFKMDDTV